MPKISELSNPGSSYNVTGGELVVVTTQGLSSISLSANDLVNRALDTITTGSVANFKATHTDFNANSAAYDSTYSTVNANSARNARTALSVETNVVPNTANWTTGYNSTQTELKGNSARWNTNANTELAAISARYTRTALSLETNVVPSTANWNYVATNSATLQSDTTVSGALSGNSTLIINSRGTFGGDHIVTDNILTVFGNISAQGTIYASGSALGDVDPVNPGGSNRTIQYNDSNAFGGAAQFAYDETNHNVGIGTQAIAIADNIHEKLTVAGNISATGKLYNEDGEVGAVSPGGTDGAIQFNNSGTLSGNANLTFDDTNVRLGIGTITPQQKLDVTTSTNGGSIPIVVSNKDTTAGTDQKVSLGFGLARNTGAFKDRAGKIQVGRELDWTSDDANIDAFMSFHLYKNNAEAEKMRIDSDGNVGIGTDNPAAKLHVNGGTLAVSGANAALEVHNSTGNTLLTLKSAHDPSLELRANQTGFTFQNAGTDATILRLNENGNIGIGTGASEPTTSLEISGTGTLAKFSGKGDTSYIKLTDAASSGGNFIGATGDSLHFWANNKKNLTIKESSGEALVGIGHDTPTSVLHLSGAGSPILTISSPDANARGIQFDDGGAMAAQINCDSSENLEFKTGGSATNKAIILGNGKVGIGTSAPSKELTVLGAISASESIYGQGLSIDANVPQITLTDLDASGTPFAKFQASAGSLEIAADDGDELAGSTISMQVDNRVVATLSGGDASTSGSFGIGTDIPAYKLHVAAPNTSTIAVSAFGEIHAGGDIVSSSSSDRRQKTNIKKLDNALDKVLTLDGVEYDWNEMAAAHRIGKHDVGVIAQQVEEVLPNAIDYRENGMMAVRYERIIPLLIESIKELKSEIEELKRK